MGQQRPERSQVGIGRPSGREPRTALSGQDCPHRMPLPRRIPPETDLDAPGRRITVIQRHTDPGAPGQRRSRTRRDRDSPHPDRLPVPRASGCRFPDHGPPGHRHRMRPATRHGGRNGQGPCHRPGRTGRSLTSGEQGRNSHGRSHDPQIWAHSGQGVTRTPPRQVPAEPRSLRQSPPVTDKQAPVSEPRAAPALPPVLSRHLIGAEPSDGAGFSQAPKPGGSPKARA